MHIKNHPINESTGQFVKLIDPQHILIKNHKFGTLIQYSWLHVIRNDTINIPSIRIEIIGSTFEHATTDKEMCTFYNIQPHDVILIKSTEFIHSYCSIYFG